MDGSPLDPRMVPHPLAPSQQPVRRRNPLALEVPRSFIFCTESKEGVQPLATVVAAAETARADPGWGYYEIETDHRVIDNATKALVHTLIEIADSTVVDPKGNDRICRTE